MGLMRLILHIRHCHHKYKLSQPLLSDYDKCDESFVTFLPEQHAVHIHSTDLYESSQVAQLGLGSQSHVKEQSDVDGNHRHHVNNVQRVMEELLPVWCEQQPRDDLKEITNTHCPLCSASLSALTYLGLIFKFRYFNCAWNLCLV